MSSGASRKRRRTRRRHLLPTLGVALVVATLLSTWLVVDLRRQINSSGKAAGTPTAGQAGRAGQPEEVPSGAPSPSPGGLTSSTATVAPGGTRGTAPRTKASKPLPPAVLGAKVAGVAALSDLIQDEGIGVPLSGGRTLWIFADTTKVGGAPHFFVTSSAAVSVGDSRRLTYATGGKEAPIEFLPRTSAERVGQSGQRYNGVWPTGATKLPDGRIIISYAKYDVTMSPQRFQFIAAGLYEYRDPGAGAFAKAGPAKRIADDMWKMTDGVVGSPVYSDGYVYFTECEDLQCYSLRTSPATLADRSKYTWWTGDGWSAYRNQRKPMSYGSGRPGKNPSTVYLPMYDLFAVVDTAAGHTQRSGQLWVGPNPWGPWSKPASFALPECPPAGCYTLNLHAGTSLPGRLRVSYATSGVGPYVRVVDVPVRIGPTKYGPSVTTS